MLKSTTILIFFHLFFLNKVIGQFSLNLESGVNNTNIQFKGFDFEERAAVNYYYFGVIPQYSLNSKTAVLLATAYSAKGYQLKESGSSVNVKYRLSYLDLVPEISFDLHKYFTVGIGSYLSLKLREDSNFDRMQWNKSVKDFHLTKPNDFGLTGSLRFNFKPIYLKLSYQYGLKNIADTLFTDQNGAPIGVEQYNRTIQIGLGYQFNFQK